MTLQLYLSPNGDRIIGTAETASATALILGIIAETGVPVYEGGTEIDWDSQQTETRNGNTIFICDAGDRWTFDQLLEHDHQSKLTL